MYNYDFSSSITKTTNTLNGVVIWTIIATVIAVIGGITLYFVFLKSKNKFTGFLAKLQDFLNFKTLVLEDILKITYLILTIFITLNSFGLIAVNVGTFFITLIVGNLALRIGYELSILLIKICRNTSDINKKLK